MIIRAYPLSIERKIRVVKYWLNTWCTQVRDLFYSCGFGYVWAIQRVYGCKEFLRLFSLRLHDMYLQEWNTSVSNTTDNRLFKQIKHVFGYESYLNINNKSVRIALSRVRLSSHLFMIERGRWGKTVYTSVQENVHFVVFWNMSFIV